MSAVRLPPHDSSECAPSSTRRPPDMRRTSGAAKVTARYRRTAIRLLLLLLVIDYADRSVLAAMAPTLQRVFAMSDTQLGVLAATFGAAGALATVPLGALVDRVRRTRLLATSAVVWTVAMALTGAAVSFLTLLLARTFLAAVTATVGPTLPSFVGDIVPPRERGRALGLVNGGQLIGSGLGVAVGALAVGLLTWRWGFWALTIPGAALAVALRRLDQPPRSREVTPDERGRPRTRAVSARLPRPRTPRKRRSCHGWRRSSRSRRAR